MFYDMYVNVCILNVGDTVTRLTVGFVVVGLFVDGEIVIGLFVVGDIVVGLFVLRATLK